MKRFDLKTGRAAAILCCAMLLLETVFIYGAQAAPFDMLSDKEVYRGILRFHVIANSNSEEDQKLKLEVRDEVLAKINEELVKETVRRHDGAGGSDQALLSETEVRRYVEDNLDKIKSTARSVIKTKGYDYDVQAALETCWIPAKTYGDVMFPAGNYEALRIIIGDGVGENWWCVLYPPLCVIDPQGRSLEELQLDEDGKTTVLKLKFKTLELFEK